MVSLILQLDVFRGTGESQVSGTGIDVEEAKPEEADTEEEEEDDDHYNDRVSFHL